MKTHVVLHLVMDWEFGKSELSNLLEDATICQVGGFDPYNPIGIENIECLFITQELENKS